VESISCPRLLYLRSWIIKPARALFWILGSFLGTFSFYFREYEFLLHESLQRKHGEFNYFGAAV
jgi:hypothetical protein